MNISNRMTVLAAELQKAESRRATGRMEQIEGDLEIGRVLLEARGLSADHAEFGKWLAEAGSTVSHHDRAAYIAMAADPERFRAVLEKTERRSIQLIYEKEFKTPFTSASKSPCHKPKQAPKMDKAVHAIERREQAGEPVTREAIVAEAGVSRGIADSALAAHKASAKPDPDAVVLSMSAQEKLDAHKRKLEKEFEYRVQTEVIKRSEQAEARLRARWDERLGALEKAWTRRDKVFTKAEFGTILKVLHPDGKHASDDTRNEAFRIFNARKIKLLDEKDYSVVPDVQQIRADMAARREKVRAENSERAKKAAATRKARQQQQQEVH